MSFESINFDMTDAGLLELHGIIEPLVASVSDEMLNFINVIRNLVQRIPAKESSWLDA